MYTTCPECSISFRVTAKVLAQANGSVRCGGCEHVFNALEFLTEEMPSRSGAATGGANVDQLAETSRRLLETLDELAGPEEVRIEDTGIEWRVLDKDEPETLSAQLKSTEEMRYDDSTLLPDDFGQESEQFSAPAAPARRETDFSNVESVEFDELQGDLALSDPDDWTDLLDEVRDPDPESESLEVEEELAAIHSQLSARDESTTKVTTPTDLDSQFHTQAEAMGLDLPASELALTDEVPLLNEADIESLAGADEEDGDSTHDTEETPDNAGTEAHVIDVPDNADTINDSLEEDLDEEDERHGEDVAVELMDEADQRDDEGDLVELMDEADQRDDEGDLVELMDEEVDEEEEESIRELLARRESTGEFEAQIDKAARSLAGEDDDDEQIENDHERDEPEMLDQDEVEDDVDLALDESVEDSDSAEIEHIVPPPTEEELTVNMEIDQEMMALATQDNEFTATLVGMKTAEELFEENADDVETIVMEGEFIHGTGELETLATGDEAGSQISEPENLIDTYALRRGKVRGGRRRYDPESYGVIAAAVVLALVLVGQVIHNSRESLATIGLFNQTVAPVYRMLGSPVTPAWDIKGWQFEMTTGNVDEGEQALTIVSRIVNRAERPLPYPLVHVSLTDRWEEIMGSRILEPGEYLAGDLDPSSPVLPGENFTAVITIEDPSAEATGFKLNVCYRVEAGTVRCAIEDFKPQ